jgi:Fur family ferric uptake transcriptional regulator
MSGYNTEQKRLLIEFLRQNSENSYTVEQIVEGIKDSAGESALGRSTVYRLMTRLVEEKQVQRFAEEGSRRFSYRIIADYHCRNHLHLKCLGCGKILHLDRETSDALLERVRLVKDFSVSEEDTLLFGSCSSCRQEVKRGG